MANISNSSQKRSLDQAIQGDADANQDNVRQRRNPSQCQQQSSK